MKDSHKGNKQHSSLVDAVETLTNIADMHVEKDVGVTETHNFTIQDKKVTYKTIHMLGEKDKEATVKMIKDTFRIILDYLQGFYRREYGQLQDPETIDGIKTIMVLVGEAAQKLDKFTNLFYGSRTESITQLNEYKKLREFYFKKVARKIDEGKVGKYVLTLTQHVFKPKRKGKLKKLKGKRYELSRHMIIDLESVKKDIDYELLFLRKENGKRFYNPRLIRNIKLVCDFGDYFTNGEYTEPLGVVHLIRDQVYQILAKNMVKKLSVVINRYYRHAFKQKERDIVGDLNQALFALYLAANPANLQRNQPVKSSTDYFHDFQFFLRRALQSRGYLKLVTYPPKKTNKSGVSIMDFVHAICYQLYTNPWGYHEVMEFIQNILEKVRKDFDDPKGLLLPEVDKKWWRSLVNDNVIINEAVKKHPHNPLHKILELLETGIQLSFDTIIQDNLPNKWCDLFFDERRIQLLRLPAPLKQEFINKAVVNEEFKGFLHECHKESRQHRHLMINLQDRTSWKEYARSRALEHLQSRSSFEGVFKEVTLPVDTDFYQQLEPYHKLNHAKAFKEQFAEHILSEDSGFWFPDDIRKVITEPLVEHIIHGVHKLFFFERNVLTRPERLSFIQIAYFFLMFKVIDHVNPDSLALVCKDGVDASSSFSGLMVAAFKMLNGEGVQPEDLKFLELMFFGPALLIRERAPHFETFNRSVEAIKVIGNARLEIGDEEFVKLIKEHFSKIYAFPIWDGYVSIKSLQRAF